MNSKQSQADLENFKPKIYLFINFINHWTAALKGTFYLLIFFFTRIVEFFQKMRVFLTICETENPVAENLTELKKTFCISAALFYKFKR